VIVAAVAGSQYVNVALKHQANESSTYGSWLVWGFDAYKAVDGYKVYTFWCTKTAEWDTAPWWGVDLEYVTYVYGVNLTNAGNGAGK
jgi:hypothetical protein